MLQTTIHWGASTSKHISRRGLKTVHTFNF
jgi:hypothetical protein